MVDIFTIPSHVIPSNTIHFNCCVFCLEIHVRPHGSVSAHSSYTTALLVLLFSFRLNMFQRSSSILTFSLVVDFLSAFPAEYPIQVLSFCSCSKYLTRGTVRCLFLWLRFLLYSFVSRSFLVRLGSSFVSFLHIRIFDDVRFQYSQETYTSNSVKVVHPSVPKNAFLNSFSLHYFWNHLIQS